MPLYTSLHPKEPLIRWDDLDLRGQDYPISEQVLVDPQTQWQTIKVNRWYGEGERQVEVCTGTAVWYHTGLPVVPIRWVLVRDPLGKFESQANTQRIGTTGKPE